MNKDDQILASFENAGESAIYYAYSGDRCPCSTQWSDDHIVYDPQWHVDNSGEDDCNGTTLLNSTESTTNIKATFVNDFETLQSYKKAYIQEKIGQKLNISIVMLGTFDSDNEVFISLADADFVTDKIVYQSRTFKIAHVHKISNVMEAIFLYERE